MDGITCKSCTHFYQHYGMRNGKVYKVFCGHCVAAKGRPRMCRPYQKVCENYSPGVDPVEDYVTKEYLTKALLDRILKLELWPGEEIPPESENPGP